MVQRLFGQFCDLRNLGRAADDIDGLMLQELAAETLRHAADNADHHLRPMLSQVLQTAEMGKDAILRMLSHRARVDEYNIGILDAAGQAETCLFERSTHQGRVQLVHLAAEALDIDRAISHRTPEYRI